jgi:WD40 repeat protein
MGNKGDAFISYTRQEGAGVAEETSSLIQGAGLSVWQDRSHMRGGEDFRRQIEEAIEGSHYVVMVLTADAFRGDREVLRGEWLTARRRGVPILPVFRGLDWKDEAIPPWLSRLHCHDLTDDNERTRLLNALRSPPRQTIRVPHNVEFPPKFVPRPKEQEEAVRLLTQAGGASRVALTTALRGAGGFGKTTLARAICFDDRVIATFTDGVLWATVGEGGRDAVEVLGSLLGSLTDDRLAGRPLEDVQGRWRELIRTKHCLVVLDDVWRESDVSGFVVRDSPSAFLITTRIPAVSVALDARDCIVDRMEPDQAAAMLGRALPEPQHLDSRMTELAGQLGYWPILLKLAARQLALKLSRNASPEQALQQVEADYEESGVTAFDATHPKERDEAVEKSIGASLRLLDDESGELSRAYQALAVTPDDVPIPLEVLASLWRCGTARARRIAEDLSDAALLDLDYRRSDQAGEVLLHHVFLHYLRGRAADLPRLHRELLDAWGDPSQLPSAYAWRWYGWHCLGAREPQRLRERLLDPDWLAVRLVRTDANVLISDCRRLLSDRPDDRTIRLLEDALRKSAHVLSGRPAMLWEQLYGRLRRHMTDELDDLQARAAQRGPWPRLHALRPNLHPAGTPLKRTLPGHASTVQGAVLLDGERQALSWSEDGTLRLWDLSSGESQVLSGHQDGVGGALLLDRERQALSWSEDGTLRLWHLSSGKSRVLPGHEAGVWGAVLLDEERQALSWSEDGTLRLWHLSSGTSRVLSGHEGRVAGAVLLDGGRQALSWSHDNTLRLWHLSSGELRVLSGHEGRVAGAVLLDGGRQALSWSHDNTLRLWDLSSGESRVLSGHQSGVAGAALLDGERRALSWSGDKTLRLWDLSSGEARVLSGHESGVVGAALLDGERQALSWSGDKTLRLWDLSSGESRVLPGHKTEVWGAVLLDGERQVLSWSWDITLRLWDLSTGESRALSGHEGGVVGAALLDGQRQALSWSHDSTLRLWDLSSGKSHVLSGHEDGVVGAGLFDEERQALSWSYDNTLRLWDLSSGNSRVLSGHERRVAGAMLFDAKRQALSWSDDNTLRLWDLSSGNSRVLSGHKNGVWGAVLLDGERQALSWSHDNTLRLWHLSSGNSRVLSGHEGRVAGAVLLDEERQALSWSYDNTLRLWDLSSGNSRVLSGHKAGVWGAVLLDGERRALSWSSDSALRLWDLSSGESRVLSGHELGVAGVVLLDGGRQALSWSYDHTLRLWDLSSGESRVLSGHEAEVVDAVLLDRERQALSWSGDGTLRLWGLSSGESRVLSGHEAWVRDAALLDGERRALSWAFDKTLRLWELETCRELGCFAFDATPTVVLPLSHGGVWVGDGLGGVHQLQFASG